MDLPDLPDNEISEREDEEWVVRDAAQHLYLSSAQPTLWESLLSALSLQRSKLLYPITVVCDSCELRERRDLGAQDVPLDKIQGSEKRAREFDRTFRLMNGEGRARWLRSAILSLRGQDPPPVSLIRVGEVYFVHDGHYRVSVARALGRREIRAEVTEWQVACRRPLPWGSG